MWISPKRPYSVEAVAPRFRALSASMSTCRPMRAINGFPTCLVHAIHELGIDPKFWAPSMEVA